MALLRRTTPPVRLPLTETFERFFEEPFFRPLLRPTLFDVEMTGVSTVPLDIYEEGKDILVKALIPGVKPEEINVEVRDDVLKIWGELKESKEEKTREYYLQETRYGRFERSVALPYPVYEDKVTATYENGILTLRMPRMEEVEGHKIKIQVKK